MGEYLEVRLDQLAQNPDNPRETLGDLDDLAEGEGWGVWGGLDERERAPLRAGRARLTSVIHHPSDPLDDSGAQLAMDDMEGLNDE